MAMQPSTCVELNTIYVTKTQYTYVSLNAAPELFFVSFDTDTPYIL